MDLPEVMHIPHVAAFQTMPIMLCILESSMLCKMHKYRTVSLFGLLCVFQAARALRDGANHWVQYRDEQRGHTFYFNKLTGERQDDKPDGFSPGDTRDPEKDEKEKFRNRRAAFLQILHQQPISDVNSTSNSNGNESSTRPTAVLNVHVQRGKEAQDAFEQFATFPDEDLLLPLKVQFIALLY